MVVSDTILKYISKILPKSKSDEDCIVSTVIRKIFKHFPKFDFYVLVLYSPHRQKRPINSGNFLCMPHVKLEKIIY